MRKLFVQLVLLSVLIGFVAASGTVRLKGLVNQQLSDTLNSVKQTQKDLNEWEKEMANKASQKGLNEQGKQDLSKTSEKLKDITKTLQKKQEAPQVPSMTESESKELIKAATHLSEVKKNLLNHLGDVTVAPPSQQNNMNAASLVSIEKAAHNIKKVEATPETAPVEMTTAKNQVFLFNSKSCSL